MFRLKKVFILCILTIISVFCIPTGKGFYPLDEIQKYYITVKPRTDGTLDMNIYIEWLVLDSTSEGPLEWVQIGIPNCYIDELKTKTDNIKRIKYDSDEGSYIRIDFDRDYYANELVKFEFSFHQKRMFHLKDNRVYYDYNPGWFDEIKVIDARVYWYKEGVVYNNEGTITGDYFLWQARLGYSETIKIQVYYEDSSFPDLVESEDYSDDYLTKGDKLRIAFLLCGVLSILVIAIVYSIIKADPYMAYRGFCGERIFYYPGYSRRCRVGVNRKGARIVNPTVSTGGRSFGGGSCACACACAGGGRAGCSKKDFYHTDLKTGEIIKAINEESK